MFDAISERGHELVAMCHDRETGARAIIAIHNSTMGRSTENPHGVSLGGTRRRYYVGAAERYGITEYEAALDDVLRLSEGMTYKSAAADLPLGGAKSVVLLPSREAASKPTEMEARAVGRFVDRLNGQYIAAEDMNVDEQYIDWMARETSFVTGGKTKASGGDPSPYTAQGTINGIKGGLRYARGDASLKGVVVAIQGLGALGYKAARIVHKEGGKLIVADTRKEVVDKAVSEFGATPADPNGIITEKCDVLCPCAIGQVINNDTIDKLQCEIIAPGANNVLADASVHGPALKSAGVVYCPDFIVNAGGVIRLGGLWAGLTEAEVDEKVDRIEQTVFEILKKGETMTSTHDAAIEYAKQRIATGPSPRKQNKPAAAAVPGA